MCTTSGWNCTAKKRFARFSMAANGADGVEATGSKPGGSDSTRSPWLIHTSSSAGSPWKSGEAAFTATLAGPYSRWCGCSTRPPSSCAMSCSP